MDTVANENSPLGQNTVTSNSQTPNAMKQQKHITRERASSENDQYRANSTKLESSSLSVSKGFGTPVIDEESEFDCEEFTPASNVNLDKPLEIDPQEQQVVAKRSPRRVLQETVSSRSRRQTISNTGDYSTRRTSTSSSHSNTSTKGTRRVSMDGRQSSRLASSSSGTRTSVISRPTVSSLKKETHLSSYRTRRATMDPMSRSMDSSSLSLARSSRNDSSFHNSSDLSANNRARTRLESRCRESENKVKRYEEEVNRLRNEASVLKKSNAEMKRELGDLRPFRRKAQSLEKELQSVRKMYETKLRTMQREIDAAKRASVNRPPISRSRPGSARETETESRYRHNLGPRTASWSRDSAANVEDEFRNASDVLSLDGPGAFPEKSSNGRGSMQRRVTVAPGEASRLLKQMSCHVKIRGLKRGHNCHSLLKLLVGYGEVKKTLVKKDIFTDVLIGYATFANPSSARNAVAGLKQGGFNATTTSSAPTDSQDI